MYISQEKSIGTLVNRENNEGNIITYNHFQLTLPNKYVITSGDSLATTKSKYRDIKHVFTRSLEEINPEAIKSVLELIAQNSLYKGEEWEKVLNKFIEYQTEYKSCTKKVKQIFTWKHSTIIDPVIGKLKNHSIGTLLINISEGMDLDVAVRKYEVIVAPTNYKRPKPIYSKAMLEKAKKKAEELGFMKSLGRRHAIIDDLSINNIKFANRNVQSKLQDSLDVFEEMKEKISINPKSFKHVEEVSIEDFITKVLPTTNDVELFIESKHKTNMVSLIAPKDSSSKNMFKWDNNFTWAYSGNITDSDMKANVKSAGGNVEGVLRFSIQWNDGSDHNRDDFDAHCHEPTGNHIYFSNIRNPSTTGQLDVDIIDPIKGKPAVENITWTNKNRMEKGKYNLFVRNFSKSGGQSGFKAEIEFNGELHSFNYDKPLKHKEDVLVADVTFDGENFTIKELLPSTTSSIELWNIKTNTFVPVTICMHSPNYWDSQKDIGNKHYFFMLNKCINEETPNGFFNEFLNNELIPHRKIFEALGSKMKVETIDNQLSGIGFSSTQRNSVIAKVSGATTRIIKIKF